MSSDTPSTDGIDGSKESQLQLPTALSRPDLKRTLKDLLVQEEVSDSDVEMLEKYSVDEEQMEDSVDPDMCVECGDQRAALWCNDCEEQYCEVCYHNLIHRTGKRKNHTFKLLHPNEPLQQSSSQVDLPSTQNGGSPEIGEKEEKTDEIPMTDARLSAELEQGIPNRYTTAESLKHGKYLRDRCRYIPLRLLPNERQLLHLLTAALSVSEYTSRVDILPIHVTRTKRMVIQLKQICAILSGLVVASDFSQGQKMLVEREFSDHAEWFKSVFEIGRRYKIQNPDAMRGSYGMMMYMIQDSMNSEVQAALGFNLHAPLKTIHAYLSGLNPPMLHLLDDELIEAATKEIRPEGKPRKMIQREIKEKEKAIETLSRRYGKRPARGAKLPSTEMGEEEVKQVLYAVGDNHGTHFLGAMLRTAYLRLNYEPVTRMQSMLHQYFKPNVLERDFSLAISTGHNGARLTHNHARQFQFVDQSLTLWSIIMRDIYQMWYLADQDLLSSYHVLRDTGQGLNRIQKCPSIGRAMINVISRAQGRIGGGWVGSSVVHLGDHNVPNALHFIDKYNQVPRILNPMIIAIEGIDRIAKDPFIYKYIEDAFGGIDTLKKTILVDFFKHAFDGSGADSYFDAGSCIDGRLTSAWNYANTISKKIYYPIFQMTVISIFGFTDCRGLWDLMGRDFEDDDPIVARHR